MCLKLILFCFFAAVLEIAYPLYAASLNFLSFGRGETFSHNVSRLCIVCILASCKIHPEKSVFRVFFITIFSLPGFVVF